MPTIFLSSSHVFVETKKKIFFFLARRQEQKNVIKPTFLSSLFETKRDEPECMLKFFLERREKYFETICTQCVACSSPPERNQPEDLFFFLWLKQKSCRIALEQNHKATIMIFNLMTKKTYTEQNNLVSENFRCCFSMYASGFSFLESFKSSYASVAMNLKAKR